MSNTNEPQNRSDELVGLSHDLTEFISLVSNLIKGDRLTKEESNRADVLFHTISYKSGTLGETIKELTNETSSIWKVALQLPADRASLRALGYCLHVVDRATGRLAADISVGIRDKQGNLIKTKETKIARVSPELPIDLFDAMKFHPKIVEAARDLFVDKHYAQAIFEAFKAVENFIKDKSGSQLYGKSLMGTVFNENSPVLIVPEGSNFDPDVQEGFKFLFMGASQGRRNPKAHKGIVQKDPFITLEYLGFASFLLKRIDYWEVGTK